MKNQKDFLKIDQGKLGVINFNNMIPVSEKNIQVINLDNIDKIDNLSDKKHYILMRKQLMWLIRNSDKLFARADILYYEYVSKTLNKYVAKRCCNFKLLEEKCIEYNKVFVNN